MLVRHQKTFNMGIVLAISFVGILLIIFAPFFGNGRNGLEFSDDLFNKLSKGSSYFIPKLSANAAKYDGTSFTTTVKLDDPKNVDKALKMFITAGAQVGAEGTMLTISGDFGKLLSKVLADCDAMYHNDGQKVSSLYGQDEKEVMALWWNVLNRMDKEFKKQKKIDESNTIGDVLRKGIEPSYNYYGIEAQSVADKAFTMVFLLIFYVAYTLWWGYAIFYMFDGLGLSMKKSKVKKEV